MYTPRIGNMFTMANTEPIFVTTNSFVKKSGHLVMGRGAAAQACRIWPSCNLYFGREILRAKLHLGFYGLMYNPEWKLGIFQVKHFWGNDAYTKLIAESASILKDWAACYGQPVHLNYPGIGNGRLTRADVEPLLADLPSNVHIWTFR